MLTATSSSVVLAGQSQKAAWPDWASAGALANVVPFFAAAAVPPLTSTDSVTAPAAMASAGHQGFLWLPITPACPMRRAREGRRGRQSAKCGMTSVPMSSIVCMTDSWEIL